MRRAQTSTEYIILIAVVIIIAVIVSSILGEFPGMGGGSNKKIDDYKLTTSKVAVDDYANFSSYSLIKIRNNHFDTLIAQRAYINGELCISEDLPVTLGIGQSITINCSGLSISGTPNINIVWEEAVTSATYVTDGGETKGSDLVDYYLFDSIVIDEDRGLIWQAGDSSGALAWQIDEGVYPYDSNDCSDLLGLDLEMSEYPACNYCNRLALCNNGSFDLTGDCTSYGGILNNYGAGSWRLPTRNDYSAYGSGESLISYFTSSDFTNTGTSYYWTGTTTSSVDYAYGVGAVLFGDFPGINKYNSGGVYVRCVHNLT